MGEGGGAIEKSASFFLNFAHIERAGGGVWDGGLDQKIS